jgi:hypothetical protein
MHFWLCTSVRFARIPYLLRISAWLASIQGGIFWAGFRIYMGARLFFVRGGAKEGVVLFSNLTV